MPTTLSYLISHRDSLSRVIPTVLTLLVSAPVYADTPLQGGGELFGLTQTSMEEDQDVGTERMLTAHTNGTLNGTISAEVTCVKTPTQQDTCQGMATFEGDVEGVQGTLVIESEFTVDGPNLEAGSLTVLSGTGELASLRGGGTFSGNFASADGTYTVLFHSGLQGVENAETDAQLRNHGSGCTLLRPMSWNVRGTTCLEGPTTPIPLANGQAYTAIGIPWGVFGEGYTRVRCNNGRISTEAKVCRRSFWYLP